MATTNLLVNGDFEAEWSGDHTAIAVLDDHSQEQREIGNIFTPPGWTVWFRHQPGTWDQPEAGDAHASRDPRRVESGDKAFKLFTFYRRHDAGLLQRVSVEPGQKLQFSAWGHAWSNHLGEDQGGHPSDPYWSDGVGRAIVAIHADDVPPLNGDPQNDAVGNVAFAVGIDPTGGTDPYSDRVRWSAPYHIYNGYCHELTVEATAEADEATVFLRSTTLWAFKHNDAYWDDAQLIAVDGDDDEEPPPPPEPTRGAPRVQYARTYVLLPPDAGAAWATAVITGSWDSNRYTVGGSADDSGIGDLDAREVIAVNPDEWPDDLCAFFEEHYPGVAYRPLTAITPAELTVKLLPELVDDVALSQNDDRWRDLDFGEVAGGWTIGQRGCLLTCLTMMLRHAYGRDVTPPLLDGLLVDAEAPYTDDEDLVGWADAIGLFGPFDDTKKVNRSYTAAELGDLMRSGWLVVLRVQGGAHFVLLDSVDGGTVNVIDPADGERKAWAIGDVSGIRAAHMSDSPTPPVPPPTPDYPIRGVHDTAGGYWLAENGLDGWCVIPLYLGTSPRNVTDDVAYLASQGVRVILNLRYSYARDDGGQGTMPGPDRLGAFEAACVETVRMHAAAGAWGACYCNEMNNPREWAEGHVLLPEYYIQSYNRVWTQTRGNAVCRFAPGAIDPYNPGWGDWRSVGLFDRVSGADFVPLHAYDHGLTADRDMMFGDDPLTGVYYNLRVLESQLATVPDRFHGLPVVVTECNHGADGSYWSDDSADWVCGALDYCSRFADGVCLFRYNYGDDRWRFGDHDEVIRAIREGVR